MPTNIPLRRGVGRAGLRRKELSANPLLKPKYIHNHLTFKGQHYFSLNLQIAISQKRIHPTFMERKQIVPSLSHRPKVQPRSEVNSREVTKHDKYYSPQ